MQKSPVKSVTVRFRASPKELATRKRLSRGDALPLSNWIRGRLNEKFLQRGAAKNEAGFKIGDATTPEVL